MMAHRTLGKTGIQVFPLGFGSAPAAFLKADPQGAARMLNFMLDQGVNLIDTAAMYPGSEEFLGDHIMHRRGEFTLVSKCGQKQPGLTGAEWSYELVSASVDAALRKLKTDQLDVMLLHSCDLETLKKGDALRALVDAREAGKIAHAGYSGDNEAAAWAAAQEDIAVIETSINVVDQRNIDVVLPACVKHNVGVLAKRPIGNAAWKDLSQQQGLYKSYAKDYTERFRSLGITPQDLGFAGDPAEAWPEIAMRFTLAQRGVSVAIIGTTKESNARANLDYVRKGPLPDQAIEKLRAAFRHADPDGKWIGLT